MGGWWLALTMHPSSHSCPHHACPPPDQTCLPALHAYCHTPLKLPCRLPATHTLCTVLLSVDRHLWKHYLPTNFLCGRWTKWYKITKSEFNIQNQSVHYVSSFMFQWTSSKWETLSKKPIIKFVVVVVVSSSLLWLLLLRHDSSLETIRVWNVITYNKKRK